MSELLRRLQADMKQAMRERAQERLTTLRFLLARVKQHEVDKRTPATDEDVLRLLSKQAKLFQESILQYQKANRDDLADKEQRQLDVLKTYLPSPLTDAELSELISQAIEHIHAKTMKDMGAVMSWLKPKTEGRTDLAALSRRVKTLLSC